MSGNRDIEIEFDDVSTSYYIIWRPPIAVASGSGKIEALHDLREAAHFCIDSALDQKLKEITKED